MRKRTLACLLVAALTAAMLVLPGAGAQPHREMNFTDVSQENWYYDYVKRVSLTAMEMAFLPVISP